jgi:hypothetical protein
MHSVGHASRADLSRRSLNRSGGRVLWATDALMYVIEGGPLPLRSPMVPFDCAKLHAMWSAGIARWSASRASREFREKAG